MEGVLDRMQAWEEWGQSVNQNIQNTSSKLALITGQFNTLVNDVRTLDTNSQTNAQQLQQITDELNAVKTNLGHIGDFGSFVNTFDTLVNDLRAVDTKSQNNAQQLQQVIDDLTAVKNDLGIIGGGISQREAKINNNKTDIVSLRSFVGINSYNSIDEVITALGYNKGSLSKANIRSMGFIDTDYNFGHAQFRSAFGTMSLIDFGVELDRSLTQLQYADNRMNNDITKQQTETDSQRGRIDALDEYTGKNTSSGLDGFIGSLGYVKQIQVAGNLLSASDIAGWGFIRSLDLPGMNLGAAKMTLPGGSFKSFNDIIGTMLSDMGILNASIGERPKLSDLPNTVFSDNAELLSMRLKDWLANVRKGIGVDNCLQGSKSKFKGLIESMETKFNDMAARFDKIISDFQAFPDSLDYLLNEADGHLIFDISPRSAFFCMKQEFKALVAGGKSTVEGQWSGVPAIHGNHTYTGLKPSFGEMSNDLGSLKDKVADFKGCGDKNLGWK